MHQTIRFSLGIPAEEILRYYQGTATGVMVTAEDGRSVRLPAQNLRSFVTDDGLHGRFQVELDSNNKLLTICRLS